MCNGFPCMYCSVVCPNIIKRMCNSTSCIATAIMIMLFKCDISCFILSINYTISITFTESIGVIRIIVEIGINSYYSDGKNYLLKNSYTIKLVISRVAGNSSTLTNGSYTKVYLQKDGQDIALICQDVSYATNYNNTVTGNFVEYISNTY